MTLKDAKGGIAAVFVDDGLNIRTLSVAESGKAVASNHEAEFGLPLVTDERTRPVKPGEYKVYISVGTTTAPPRIALPLPDDGHHRYRLGTLTVIPTD